MSTGLLDNTPDLTLVLCSVAACRQSLRKHGLRGVVRVRVSLYFIILLKKAGSRIEEVNVGVARVSLRCGSSCGTFINKKKKKKGKTFFSVAQL